MLLRWEDIRTLINFGRLTNEDEQIVNESLKKVSALDIADNEFFAD